VHPDVLRVHSTKIEELVIDGDADSWLGSVDIVAPVLKFIMNTVSMSFSAPIVEILSWHCRLKGTAGINGLWSLMNLKCFFLTKPEVIEEEEWLDPTFGFTYPGVSLC
jgi:hypothetical protein